MRPCDIVQRPGGTGSVAACSALLGLLTAAAPAHAVATIAADTTRAVLRLRVTDPTIESLQVRTVPAFAEDAGATTLFVSGYAFWQGAGFGEAGQFIALRRLG